jgi:hypothetical protein
MVHIGVHGTMQAASEIEINEYLHAMIIHVVWADGTARTWRLNKV